VDAQPPVEDRKLVGRDIKKVEFGWPLGKPYCRALGKRLWEVRSDMTARVIFFIKDAEMVLHGFEKKMQKTLPREINTALKRKRELE